MNDWRVSGFTFQTATASYSAIYIGLYSSHISTGWRIDHNKFISYHYPVVAIGTITGVIDHNEFHGGGISLNGPQSIAWTADTLLGGNNFVFVEDNTFDDTNALTPILHVIIGNWGVKYVFRYNTVQAIISNVI